MPQAIHPAKISWSSLFDIPIICIFGAVRFIWNIQQNHPQRGHQITVGYGKVPLSFNNIRQMSLLDKPTITTANHASTLFPAKAWNYLQ